VSSVTVPEPYEALIPYVSQAFGLTPEALASAFRPADPSDLHELLALRRAVVPGMWWDDEAFVRWRYFGRRDPAGRVPYWVFAHDGTVAGACGLEPVTLVVDGDPVPAVRTMDIMVRPDLDGLGLGAFMNLRLFQEFPIGIVTGSNDRSHRMLVRLFRHSADLVVWKTAITSRDLVHERLPMAHLAHVVSAAADSLLALFRRRINPPNGIDVRPISRFDDRVTALSRRCERPGRVLVRRSEDYLNWRFFENPRCDYIVHGAFAGERLVAYVASRFNLAHPNPRREGEIVDWMDEPGHRNDSALPALFASAVAELARREARIVTCAASGAGHHAAARANGFRLRSAQRIPFFARASVSGLHERLTAGGGWFLTRADLDVE